MNYRTRSRGYEIKKSAFFHGVVVSAISNGGLTIMLVGNIFIGFVTMLIGLALLVANLYWWRNQHLVQHPSLSRWWQNSIKRPRKRSGYYPLYLESVRDATPSLPPQEDFVSQAE